MLVMFLEGITVYCVDVVQLLYLFGIHDQLSVYVNKSVKLHLFPVLQHYAADA